MKKPRRKWTGAQIAAICIVSVPAALWALLGVISFLGGVLITVSFVIMYLICPAALVLVSIFVIRSKLHKGLKILICAALLVAVVLAVFYVGFWGHFRYDFSYTAEDALEEYPQAEKESSEFPEVSELGPFEAIEYHYFVDQLGPIFITETHILICRYGEEEYPLQKQIAEEAYVFQEAPVSADGSSCDPEVTVDDYVFRMLAFEEQRNLYPKYMFFLAANDQTREIVYLYTKDDDLDYITSLQEHLLQECGWKHIR